MRKNSIIAVFIAVLVCSSTNLVAQDLGDSNIQTFGGPSDIPPAPNPAPENLNVSQTKGDLFNQAEYQLDKKLRARQIDLRTVLASGLNKNIDQIVRKFTKEKVELDWKDDFQKFWFPTVSLKLASGDQLVNTVRTSSTVDTTSSNVPDGTIALDFGSYTVFNWGKDYLEYLNDKQSYKRSKEVLSESRRQLRFTLIAQYFNLVRYKKIKTHRREQLKQTSFIHRLARQKLSMRKISRQEYYQTRAEYLRAQSLYQEAQEESIAQDETLANLLGDDLKSTYKPSEQLKFIGLNTSKKEALTLALRQSATYKQAKSDMENANRTFQKTIKESLPLPEVKLNLGAYKTSFSKGGSYTQFENPNGDRDVEIVASVNLTWNIIGEGGAFNSRHRKRAYLEKRINEEKFFNSKRKIEVGVYTILRRIRFLERKSEVSESQLKNSRNAFDATLDNYMSGKTRFSDLKIALDRSIEAYVNFEDSKYEHLIRKLELAERMGIEDFPGANFENLAQRY